MLSQYKDVIDILRRDLANDEARIDRFRRLTPVTHDMREWRELKYLNIGKYLSRVNQSGACTSSDVITKWRAEAEIRNNNGGQNYRRWM